MEGKRIDITDEHPMLYAGEYGKNRLGRWYCCPPDTTLLGDITEHQLTEHEDGTITVAPSILITGHDSSWHGYLEKGVWRKV